MNNLSLRNILHYKKDNYFIDSVFCMQKIQKGRTNTIYQIKIKTTLIIISNNIFNKQLLKPHKNKILKIN